MFAVKTLWQIFKLHLNCEMILEIYEKTTINRESIRPEIDI